MEEQTYPLTPYYFSWNLELNPSSFLSINGDRESTHWESFTETPPKE